MAEGKERKKKSSSSASSSAAEVQRVANLTAGEMLRQARTEKKLGLEDISAAIHIRVAQLRAIEEGNIEALPGMTYALGFVRSYANYLKLNSGEVVNKFKTEHGAMKPPMPELHIPQTIGENRMPDPMIVGITAVGAVLLLLLWTIFSGGSDDEIADIANEIPPAPAIESSSLTGMAAPGALPDTAVPAPAVSAPAADEAVAEATVPVEAPAADAAEDVLPAEEGVAPVATMMPLPRPQPMTPEELAAQQAAEAAGVPAEGEKTEEIVIKSGKGRVVLQARERSWIQVKNRQGRVVFERVLRQGERYYVPDEPGLSLITSNAGGIDVVVDGSKGKQMGKPGEIVRGVPLEPDNLKKRVKVSNY